MEFNDKELVFIGEEYVIKKIIKPHLSPPEPGESLGPLDDVRDLIPHGPRLTFSVDGSNIASLKLEWRTYADVGWAALTGALSDHVVKGSHPHAVMVALGVSPNTHISSLKDLIAGIYAAVKHYGVRYMGGDLNSSVTEWIAVSVIGYTSAKRLPRRDGAKPGDKIIVTGKYGAMGMVATGRADLVKYFPWIEGETKRPIISIDLAEIVAANYRWIHASMDVSDGLGYTVITISRDSRVKSILKRPPVIHAGVLEYCGEDVKCIWDLALNGGEEYGGVFYVDPGGVEQFTQQLSEAGIPYRIVGEAVEGEPGLVIEDYPDARIKRWDQFMKWTDIR